MATENNERAVADQLVQCTTRIECRDGSGNVSVGTAFVFNFTIEKNRHLPLVVTNRHVVSGCNSCSMFFSALAPGGGPDRRKPPVSVSIQELQSNVVGHPDPDIDLVAIPFFPIIEDCNLRGTPIHHKQFTPINVPSESDRDELTAIEDIIMIGYPVGLWDEANNQPLVRRGITATDPGLNYMGKPQFIIDAACFPGSSGSPVVLYNMGPYVGEKGSLVIGSRMQLLGVLFAGPQFTAAGEVLVEPVPSSTGLSTSTAVPMNLGVVVHASEILVFKDVVGEIERGA